MNFKWKKGLLFPSLMLIGTTSFSIQSPQLKSENNNTTILVKSSIESTQELNTKETVPSITIVGTSFNFPVEKSNSFATQETSTLIAQSSSLLYSTIALLSLLMIFAGKAQLENSQFSRLKRMLKISDKHVHYLSFWNYQWAVSLFSEVLADLTQHLFQSFWKHNNAQQDVSRLHHISTI